MFNLLRYESTFEKQWNLFIKNSKNGLFFFDRNFMEYHKDRFEDHSLVFLKGEEIVAAFPANEKEKKIISHGGLTFGSLVIAHSIKTIEVMEMLQQIAEYYKSNGFEEIVYKAIPYVFAKYPSQEDIYALFRMDAELIRRDVSSIIEIKNRIKFSETKRQLVKKCAKNAVSVKESNDFRQYWNLLQQVLNKFNASPVHSLEEINQLNANFPENIKLFEAYQDNELLAGIVMFDFGNVVHTQYMAASDKGRKIGALDFINNHLLENVYADRPYYSFGISTEDNGNYLNEGLIQQKENMGARGIALDTYKINLKS